MRGGRRDEGLADLEDAVGLARQSGADESLAHVLTKARFSIALKQRTVDCRGRGPDGVDFEFR